MIFTAKLEQTFAYTKRMKYIAKTDSFIEKVAQTKNDANHTF